MGLKNSGGERVLLVDDEIDLCDTLRYHLLEAGYRVEVAHTGREALEACRSFRPALIVLDMMLPDLSGNDVCRALLRDAATEHIPILVLSARDSELDRVVAFELGVADYVGKPFSMRELLLRVAAILRRATPESASAEALSVGPVTVDRAAHRVWVGDDELELTPREFSLLETLLARRGRVQTRSTLLDAVWPTDADVVERTVDAAVMRLRGKLGAAAGHLETVRGVGYRWRAS